MVPENLKAVLHLFSFSALPTREELKRRYRELVKRCHPDHQPGGVTGSELSTRRTQDLNRAYAALLRALPRPVQPPDAPAPSAAPSAVQRVRPSAAGLAARGDRDLERAVLAGCLVRHPRGTLVAALRERLSATARGLQALGEAGEGVADERFQGAFHRDLLICFLRSTEPGVLLQGLASERPTRHFRRLMQANGRLDAGVRAFYRYLESGRLGVGTLAEIPASHLREAGLAYEGLLAESSDPRHRAFLQARHELTRLFTQRIRDPRLAGVGGPAGGAGS